jgi:hypothetical protein
VGVPSSSAAPLSEPSSPSTTGETDKSRSSSSSSSSSNGGGLETLHGKWADRLVHLGGDVRSLRKTLALRSLLLPPREDEVRIFSFLQFSIYMV